MAAKHDTTAPRGRPHKPAGERAEAHLHIRVPEQDVATWRAKAQAAGVSLSEWVRKTLNGDGTT